MPAITRLSRSGVAATTAALVCALTAAAMPAGSATADTQDRVGRHASDPRPIMSRPASRRQTSDGKPGLVVGPPVADKNGRTVLGRAKGKAKNDASYEIAPGVTLREWDQVDGRQPIGQVRANLITVNLDAPNISFEYLASKYVPARKPVSELGRMEGAIAAVNGDFFDISDTGAPLGVGFRRGEGLVQGAAEGWIPENMSMWFNGNEPALGKLSVQWKIRQRQSWPFAGLNLATIPRGQFGLYTSAWGWTDGYSVTGGKRRAREVVIRKNRIVSNRYKLSQGRKIRTNEKVLIAVGSATKKLKNLHVGKRITFKKSMYGANPDVAISGDRPLLVNGLRTVVDNRLAHPRTAVGIDADGRKLLILVVDGRSSSSRGYTMVELADMMTALGAENALNLDGGGSTTMWGRTPTGQLGLINEPSDGAERLVPNGLGVVYHGVLPPVIPLIPTSRP